MLTRRAAMFSAAAAVLMLATPALADELKLPRQKVELIAPPFVHAHEQATKQVPKIMEFKLVIEEKKVVIDEQGTTFQAMTFNGSMPGPLMVVLGQSRDQFNAAQYRLPFGDGCAWRRRTYAHQPGRAGRAALEGYAYRHLRLSLRAGRPMIPWHVVSGMNGAVMVLPRDGLNDGNCHPLKYDRVYYIGEQDMYVPRDEKGKFKSYDSPGEAYTDTVEVMRKLTPTHVVFNGKVGALTGKNALTANVGENVLIVHSQANRDSRPHLIGGHGDYVWETGKFTNAPETGLETWFIRGGSAGAAMYKFLQPGIYAYVTHNLIEAAELGATAHFKVEGKWNDDLMTQVKAPTEIPAANIN
jgi:nitrite reductase (NO-forming)